MDTMKTNEFVLFALSILFVRLFATGSPSTSSPRERTRSCADTSSDSKLMKGMDLELEIGNTHREAGSSGSGSPVARLEHALGVLNLQADQEHVEPIVNRFSHTAEAGQAIVIGIAGGSGSGKTTLAQAIYKEIGEDIITYISHDSYYKDISHLPFEQREKQNFDHPDSLDTALLVEHVKLLKSGQGVNIPIYSFSTHSRESGSVPAQPRPVILVEGILIFSDPALFNLFDIKIFVDTDDDIRLIRRIQRDTAERGRSVTGVVNQYLATVRPMHLEFVEPSKRNADIIVPVGLNSVALDLVVSKLRAQVGK